MYQELTEDKLAELVAGNDKVMVQYAAGWCGNCRLMKPKFRKMAESHDDVTFVVVDAEKYPNSRQLAQVDNLPTFAAFEGGRLKGQVQTSRVEQLQALLDEIAPN